MEISNAEFLNTKVKSGLTFINFPKHIHVENRFLFTKTNIVKNKINKKHDMIIFLSVFKNKKAIPKNNSMISIAMPLT